MIYININARVHILENNMNFQLHELTWIPSLNVHLVILFQDHLRSGFGNSVYNVTSLVF